MKRFAAALAIALLAAALGVGLASPASAGGTTIDVNPASGPVGTTVDITAFCGYEPGSYTIAFLNQGRSAGFVVVEENAPVGSGPYEYEFEIPAVLDGGPDAPQDVVPGTYEVGIECDNFEVEAYAEFQVTPSPTTTTEATTTTTLAPTTTTAPAALPLAITPTFTG